MSHTNTILNQLLKIIPRHEFEALANHTDGRVKATALSRWSQFVTLTVGQLGQRSSLRDIENTLHSQRRVRYHLGSQSISKSALSRANEKRDYGFLNRPGFVGGGFV